MNNATNKSFFYISNLGTNKISIINGEDFNIVDEIIVGPKPFEMAVDNKSNVYIATNRNEKITIFNGFTKNIRSINIPNNGHVKVDSLSQKVYVSDTEVIYIYSLSRNEIIEKISGFVVVDGIELNSDGSKLFVLDIFLKEIKIYDTLTLNLIKTYKDIGESPNYFWIGVEEKYLYIANKEINKLGLNGSVTLINLDNDSTSYISFPKGSSITSIEGDSSFLYILNSGLSRIEIMDILDKSIICTLKTSLDNPQKTKFLKDIRLLLVTSRDSNGRGAVDIIDIDNQKIIKRINFNEKNSCPYDIAFIQENSDKEEKALYNNINIINEETTGDFILANKIISSYKEKIIFKDEKIELISESKIRIEEITFENCKVIEGSKKKEIISDDENYIILNFEFIIPYYVTYVDSETNKINIKGSLIGKQKAILQLLKEKIDNIEFIFKSSSRVMYSPYIEDNFIIFDVNSIITTYLIKEEIIFIPSNQINNKFMEVEK